MPRAMRQSPKPDNRMSVTISVVIPCYNGGKYLPGLLENISQQTFKDYEVVVVDDGSKDDTREQLQALSQQYDFLRYVSVPNGGVTKARWNGVQHAQGEWITFVDVDDALPVDALADLYSCACDDTDIVVGYARTPPTPFVPKDLTEVRGRVVSEHGYPPSPFGKLFRRTLFSEAIFDIPREINYGEDCLMNIKLAYATQKVPRFLFKRVYTYIRNVGSVSVNHKKTLDYEYLYNQYRLASVPPQEQGKIADALLRIRLQGLKSVSLAEYKEISRKQNHPLIESLRADVAKAHYKVPLKRLIFLRPSLWRIVYIAGWAYARFLEVRYAILRRL